MADLEPIAIIGMGCRFPGGVGSPEDLWNLVSEGRSGWAKVPADRWNADSFYHPEKNSIQAWNSKGGYFLHHDVSKFDSKFFNFSSHEADITDPQQRLLLETTYEALENAGVPIETIRGSNTAVYVAMFTRDYDRMGYKDLDRISKYHIGGTGEAILANRISYVFDLRGGSMTIDTGCSGSLVALHEACHTIRAGESRMVIVGSTQLLLHPDQMVAMSPGGTVNPDGKCYTFDDRGEGYGRGEGVGSIILKKLSHAIEDGDTIHAVIRNSGMNQDGKTNGIALPNSEAQEALIRSVYRGANLDPHDTLYVEAHGTGTIAGDHAEVRSISNAFNEKRRKYDLPVGSVKTNVGHPEASSGLVGLIKAVMVLKKRQVPPNLNYKNSKPGLRLKERQIHVPLELSPLLQKDHKGPVRVSLNSFGYGGTNCHVIIESSDFADEYAKRAITNGNGVNGYLTNGNGANGHLTNGSLNEHGNCHSNGYTNGHTNGHTEEHTNGTNGLANGHITNGHVSNGDSINTNGSMSLTSQHHEELPAPLLFPLMSTSETTLSAMPGELHRWLKAKSQNGAISYSLLKDLSYTLGCRRSTFRWRKVVQATTAEQLMTELESSPRQKAKADLATNTAFVFTGQGAQWATMGRELLDTSYAFQWSLKNAQQTLEGCGCDWNLVEELLKSAEKSRIQEPAISQPVTTALQIALVDVLADVGIRPQYVVGHSSGEIAAAYAAGALTQEDAIKSSFRRGQFSAKAKERNDLPGSMLAVGCGEKTAAQMLKVANMSSDKGRVKIACVNSPESVTLSGDEPAIDYMQGVLYTGGVFVRKLKVETAYHSHHMEKISEEYQQSLQDVHAGRLDNGVKFFSSVTGKEKTADFGAAYWTQNLVSQVRFDAALAALTKDMAANGPRQAANIIIEIGPHSALQGPIRQILSAAPTFKHTYLSALSRKEDATKTVLNSAARAFELGAKLDWKRLLNLKGHSKETGRVVPDLPAYPWDHRQSHWFESRLSRDHRFRKFPFHDLCGLLDVSSTVLEPRWRHQLSVERLPWLKHHVIDDQVIFPGTGYATMGLEALQQLHRIRESGSRITMINSRNLGTNKPVIIPGERGDGAAPEVELQMVVTRVDDSPWVRTTFNSQLPDNSWQEVGGGVIRVDTEPIVEGEPEPAPGLRDESLLRSGAEAMRLAKELAVDSVDIDQMYEDQRRAGDAFGPSFKQVFEGAIGRPDENGVIYCWAKLRLPDLGEWMPKGYQQPRLIHPTTLDAVNHVIIAAFHRYITFAAVMPVDSEEQFWSPGITTEPGAELFVALKLEIENKTSARGSNWIFQHEHGDHGDWKLVSHLKRMRIQAIGEDLNDSVAKPFDRTMNYQLDWKADADMLSPLAFQELTSVHVAPVAEDEKRLEVNEKAAAIYLQRTADAATVKSPETAASPQLKAYASWIAERLSCGELPQVDPEEHDAVLQKSRESGAEGLLLERIGTNLVPILDNEVDPQDLVSENDALTDFYSNGLLARPNAQLAAFLKLLTHKKPNMQILEIGAGSSGTCEALLQALGDASSDLIEKYTFTDNSATLLEKASTKLERWNSQIVFKSLDISKDLAEQTFQPAQYDLVIASGSLHREPSVDKALANIRSLLKPNGRFVFVEPTQQSTALVMVFGALPGWWSSEDGRNGSPLLSEAQWTEALTKNSFGGIELQTPDYQGPNARLSLFVSKAVEQLPQTPETLSPVPVEIIHNGESTFGKLLSKTLASSLDKVVTSTAVVAWDAVVPEQDEATFHIVLDSANSPILAQPPKETFEIIKNLVTTTRKILWVSFQETVGPEIAPLKALITGFARTVRRENEGVQFHTVDVPDVVNTDDNSALVKSILQLINPILSSDGGEGLELENEYRLSNGKFEVPRLYPDASLHDWTDRLNGRSKEVDCKFLSDSIPLNLTVEQTGLLSSLRFVEDKKALTPLAPHEIQIKSKAFGLNFRDVFIALGQMTPRSVMAGETAGIVTAVGSDPFTQKTFRVGDRVTGVLAQPFASHARLSAKSAAHVPDSMTLTEAASIPVVFATVYYGFMHLAHLTEGQTVLIHAASGGVGQAAIQMAKHLGAEIFLTIGAADKKKTIMDLYDIPEDRFFSSRGAPDDMRRWIMGKTNNRGVDVVLNSISGETLAESFDCLAPMGTHIELGKADMYRKGHLELSPFERLLTFASFDLIVLIEQRPMVFFNVMAEVMKLMENGTLKPVYPVSPVPVNQIERAFRLIAERKHLGKVVIECDDDTVVKAVLPPPQRMQLKRDGTYVIAGGLGDIGRRVTKLLAKLGAGTIVTLSRRTLDPADKAQLEKEVEELGGKIHVVKCDMTNKDSLQSVVDFCKSLPPVKGVINGGMVLRDRPISHMSVDDWNISLAPKVTGTLNLDDAFAGPKLDFFLVLASISGAVGKAGQGNYAAGNTFQDAFVNERNGLGHTRYISLDLPAVEGSDSIISLPTNLQEMMRQVSILMTFDEVFQLLEYAMTTGADGKSFHSIMGFDRQSMTAAADEATLTSASMFRTIPRTRSSESTDASGASTSRDVESLLANAVSIDEAVQVILDETTEKFISFLNIDTEDVTPDSPLSSFGLDSLVSIELKNWMVRTFKVTLQASELTGAPSIAHLCQLLANRSRLVKDSVRASEGDDNEQDPDAEAAKIEGEAPAEATAPQEVPTEEGIKYDCCPVPETVPKLPVPELETVMRDHVEEIAHMATSEEELSSFRASMEQFIAPGSTAHRLWQGLVEKSRDPSIENWSERIMAEHLHLKLRQGLQFTNFMALHHPSPSSHTQAERAALLATTAFNYKLEIDAGPLPPLYTLEVPLCTAYQKMMFNTYRHPVLGCDETIKHEGDHCVVLRRGRLFRVELRDEHGLVTLDKLKYHFTAIVDAVDDEGSWAGILTSDNRDTWAKTREELSALDPKNFEYLQTIETAAFCINLDDNAPDAHEEQIKQWKLGDGFNRWNDKGLQFIVGNNGNSAVIVEHSYLDGITPIPLHERIRDAIATYVPPIANGTNGVEAFEPKELALVMSPEIEEQILGLRARWQELTEPRDFITRKITSFGGETIHNGGLPPKGTVDMMMQLATTLYQGHVTPHWQPTMLGHFHKGRHDMVQLTSADVRAFVEAASDDSVPAMERRTLMLKAARNINDRIKDSAAGQGYFRLWNILHQMWPVDEPLADVYSHPLQLRSESFTFVSNLNGEITRDGITTPMNPNCVRFKYQMYMDRIEISMNCPTGKMEKLLKALGDAAAIVEELVFLK